MEVWLKDEKNNTMFRFPIIPMPLGVDGGAGVDTVSIVKKGKIAIYNGIEPRTIKLDSIFPNHNYSACNYTGFPKPYECVEIIEKWKNSGARLRYIVTETPINIPVIITNFSYDHVNGTGNLKYSLTLMEKEEYTIPQWTPPSQGSNNVVIGGNPKNPIANQSYARSMPTVDLSKNNRKIHTVKKGEYLYMIAQKYYGDGRQYKKIKNNAENQKKYPRLKKDNYIFVGWKLVIP